MIIDDKFQNLNNINDEQSNTISLLQNSTDIDNLNDVIASLNQEISKLKVNI